ncbi:MAG: TonB-dependent receptor, partial [Steroidobacteraceae bacterium]
FKANAATGLPLDPAQLHFERTIDDSLEQRALFGEITYRFTDSWAVTLGGRYFDYEKSAVTATTVPFPPLLIGLSPPTSFDFDEDGFVSKVGISYQASEGVLLYAQANEGFRPGGANQVIALPVALQPYEADSLWNYEVGVKSSWLEDRMTLNVAAFRIDWDNMQVTATTPNGAVSFISNASASQIDGLELETLALVSQNLELSFAAAYLDAKLSENVTAGIPVAFPGLEGDRIPNVPKFSASIAAEYQHALGASLQGSVRVDASYVATTFSELRPNNPFYEVIEDYTIANLRLRVASLASNWNADLFVNNVLDEVAIGRVLSGPFGRDLAFSAPPRTIGVNLAKKF